MYTRLTPTPPDAADYFDPYGFETADNQAALHHYGANYDREVRLAMRRHNDRVNRAAWTFAAGGCLGCANSPWALVNFGHHHRVGDLCPSCKARKAAYTPADDGVPF